MLAKCLRMIDGIFYQLLGFRFLSSSCEIWNTCNIYCFHDLPFSSHFSHIQILFNEIRVKMQNLNVF